MRALTLRPEFAESILAGRKHIENRSWGREVRGRIAIHRGGEGGAIVALATVADVVTPEEAAIRLPAEAALAVGPLCWILTDIRPVGPFPCKGALSLWRIDPSILTRLNHGQESEEEEEGR
jgi:hypothetical protein